jgi:hypothetical protein
MTVAMAAVFLKERVRRYRWWAVIVGFAGIVVMLAPHFDVIWRERRPVRRRLDRNERARRRSLAASPRRAGDHSTTRVGLSATGRATL